MRSAHRALGTPAGPAATAPVPCAAGWAQNAPVADNQTRPTQASVEAHLAALDDTRRAECRALSAMMSEVTGQAAVMWGPSIVGFGSYRYRGANGRDGEMCRTGFASRTSGIAIYLLAPGENQGRLLGRLGRHRMGQSCLTVRRLADVDLEVLRLLVADSVAEVARRHG